MKNFVRILLKVLVLSSAAIFLKRKSIRLQFTKTKITKNRYLFVILPSDLKIVVTSLLYSVTLTARGHEINYLICDGLEGCELTTYKNTPVKELSNPNYRKSFCLNCSSKIIKVLENFYPRKILKLSNFQIEDGIDIVNLGNEIKNAVDMSALANSVRYNAHIPNYDENFHTNDIFQQSAENAAATLNQAILKIKPNVVVSHHGIYLPTGLLPQICKKHKISYICWNFSYKKQTVIFSHGDTYHKTIPNLTIDAIKKELKTVKEVDRKSIDSYVESKTSGASDWISYYDIDIDRDSQKLSNFSSKYKFRHAILTNVIWDAFINQFNKELPFKDQIDWIIYIIETAKALPTHGFIIRVHPAEVKHPIKTRVKLDEILLNLNISLPENVFLLNSCSKISSYSVIRHSELCHVFSSKIGLEAALMGKPVTISGDAWIRNKNVGFDINNRNDLRELIRHVEQIKLSGVQKENAYLFADYFLNHRSIHLPQINPKMFSNNMFSGINLLDTKSFPMTGKTTNQLLNVFEKFRNI